MTALNLSIVKKVDAIYADYADGSMTMREADRAMMGLNFYLYLSGNPAADATVFENAQQDVMNVASRIEDPAGMTYREMAADLKAAYEWDMLDEQEADRWLREHCPNMAVTLCDGTRLPLEPLGPPETPCCESCGLKLESADEMVMANGHVFCGSDCAHDAGYEQCRYCDEWELADYGHFVSDGFYCSGECADSDGWRECERCGCWTRRDESCTVSVGGCVEEWCDRCACDWSRECYGCGERFADDDLSYCDDDDEYYCEPCFPESSGLHEYGYRPFLEFRGDAKKSPYLGMEWETDGGCDRNAYVRALSGIDGFDEHFWMTKDSSLSNGVEITGHPMTLAYLVSISPMMERIREEALAHGYRSHDGGRCGLHVHVNRDFFGKSADAQDLGGYKMMRLLQRFESRFLRFSRRRDSYWCCFQTRGNYAPENPEEAESTAELLDKAKRMKRETDHAQALNFQHGATFEIRIFRGTLNLSTLYACLAMANGLAHVAKMHSAFYVENVTWTQLMVDVVKSCDEPTAAGYLREYLDNNELM